ncbi:MAG: Clp protease ClpP [Synergistaceae bacterium]|jgi:ATP-dependent protease ClpP protease subunit|nr:Clp protease ClpP [Synergistaceae bacterium]
MAKMAWTVTAKSEIEGEVLLYDDIGGWSGKTARDFIKELKDLGDISTITLRINSAGGDVFEAQAIYSYLRTHKARKTVRIDGLAASAASLVAMAGDKVIMPSNALMMIHNPWSLAIGDSDEMRKSAEILDKVRDTLVAVYAAKTGLDYEKVRTMMDDETWMSADEALNFGFCDETDEAIEIAACAHSLKEGDVSWITGVGEAKFSRNLAAKMPESAKKVPLKLLPQPKNIDIEEKKITKNEEETVLDIKNIADLEKEFPQLVNELRADVENAAHERGVAAERERLKALDGLAGTGREAIITKAKYEDPKDARDVAIELLQADSSVAALAARQEDAAAVNTVLQPTINVTTREHEEEVETKVSNAINEMRGYKHE